MACSVQLLKMCSNVQSLHVPSYLHGDLNEMDGPHQNNKISQLLDQLRELIVVSSSLKTLALEVPLNTAKKNSEGGQEPKISYTLIEPAKQINNCISLQHEWTLSHSERHFILLWRVGRLGNAITWTDKNYIQSVPISVTLGMSFALATLYRKSIPAWGFSHSLTCVYVKYIWDWDFLNCMLLTSQCCRPSSHRLCAAASFSGTQPSQNIQWM